MAAVLRAAKAEAKAMAGLKAAQLKRNGSAYTAEQRWGKARRAALVATVRLVAVEKEVKRG